MYHQDSYGSGKTGKKVREFEWPGKDQGKIFFWKCRGKSKIGATRCQIFRLKRVKFDFRWGSTTDPTGEFTVLPQTP